jgi:hypothetical protein
MTDIKIRVSFYLREEYISQKFYYNNNKLSKNRWIIRLYSLLLINKIITYKNCSQNYELNVIFQVKGFNRSFMYFDSTFSFSDYE